MSVFILLFLFSLASDSKEICLSSDHQSVTLPDKKYLQIESRNQWALLETYETPEEEGFSKLVILLMNLKTMETTALLTIPLSDDNRIEPSNIGNYGFSKDGSIAWAYSSLNHTLKIWNLPEVNIKAEIVFTKGHVLSMEMQEDGFTLGSFEILWPPPEMQSEELPFMEFFNYFNANAKAVFRTLHLKTLHQNQKTLTEIGTKLPCSKISVSKNRAFFTDKDGSLYKISLTTEKEPIKIFDSIEGLNLFDEFHSTEKHKLSENPLAMLDIIRFFYSSGNCSVRPSDPSSFLLSSPKEGGYILRLPEEGKEFLLPLKLNNKKNQQKAFNEGRVVNLPSVPQRRHFQTEMNFRFEGARDGLEGRAYELYERIKYLEDMADELEERIEDFDDTTIDVLGRSKLHEEAERFDEVVYEMYDRIEDLEDMVDELEGGEQEEEAERFEEVVYEMYDRIEDLENMAGVLEDRAYDLLYEGENYENPLNYLWSYINYPFFINFYSNKKEMTVYHIPSEQSQTIHTGQLYNFIWGGKGSFSFETRKINRERRLQVLLHPFDPIRRTLMYEWSEGEICDYSVNKENNLAFVNTVQGDFFVFNLETNQVTRHFVGGCFQHIHPLSQTKFLFYTANENNEIYGNPRVKLKNFNKQCVEPLQIVPDDIQNTLIHLEQAKNLTENSLFSLLVGVLEQERAVKEYPKLITKILWNVLAHSPALYLSLNQRYPFLKTLSPPEMTFNFKTNKPYLDGALALLKLTVSEAQETRLSEWDFLHPIQPILKLLPSTERNFYIEKITISLTNKATREIPLFRDIFQSKLYYTANGHVKELFGLTRKPVSDITLARRKREKKEELSVVIDVRVEGVDNYRDTDNNKDADSDRDREERPQRIEIRGYGDDRYDRISRRDRDNNLTRRGRITRTEGGNFDESTSLKDPLDSIKNPEEKPFNSFTTVILASDPIEGYPSVPTDFGIHYAIVKEASREIKRAEPGTILLDKMIQWKVLNGQSYRAQIKVNVKKEKNIRELALSSGPDYSAVWQDSRMVGVVIVGSSLRGFSRNLLEEYFSYFKELGFQFSGSETEDLKGFLLKRIQNCEIDYFLRESHSGGDERNLLRIDKRNHIIRGIFTDKEGREEVIYLIFPQVFQETNKVKTDLLSYEEFRQAIALREANNCGQITYFSTGCWSDRKALYEVEAVNSTLFLNIPSIDVSDTFYNKEKSAIRSLLNSYRQGLDFDGFREALKGKDPYIFPDEPQYQERIFDRIQVPLDIHISLEQKEKEIWKKIAPDEAL